MNGVAYHAFPNFDELIDPKVHTISIFFRHFCSIFYKTQVEQELRRESFGYRAKFINRAAQEIKEKGGLEWFQKVQNMSYKDAHAELIQLTGIGPKVTFFCKRHQTFSKTKKLFYPRSPIVYA